MHSIEKSRKKPLLATKEFSGREAEELISRLEDERERDPRGFAELVRRARAQHVLQKAKKHGLMESVFSTAKLFKLKPEQLLQEVLAEKKRAHEEDLSGMVKLGKSKLRTKPPATKTLAITLVVDSVENKRKLLQKEAEQREKEKRKTAAQKRHDLAAWKKKVTGR